MNRTGSAEGWAGAILLRLGMEKLTPKERAELLYRLKHGPVLSRNECVKYLLKIYEAKREKESK